VRRQHLKPFLILHLLSNRDSRKWDTKFAVKTKHYGEQDYANRETNFSRPWNIFSGKQMLNITQHERFREQGMADAAAAAKLAIGRLMFPSSGVGGNLLQTRGTPTSCESPLEHEVFASTT